ncbi:hypothetical protein Tco_0721429 [Tanacetum coccineum]
MRSPSGVKNLLSVVAKYIRDMGRALCIPSEESQKDFEINKTFKASTDIKKLRFLSILLCRSPSSSPSVYFFADLLAPHLPSRINGNDLFSDAVPAQGNSKVENRMTFIIFMLQRYSMEGSGDENGNGMDHQYCGMRFLHLNLSNKLSVPVLNGEQITLHSGYKHMDYYEKTLRLHSARIVVMDNGHVA